MRIAMVNRLDAKQEVIEKMLDEVGKRAMELHESYRKADGTEKDLQHAKFRGMFEVWELLLAENLEIIEKRNEIIKQDI